MGAYYNEFDPKAAAWLRELIKRDLIAPGEVDERSITDVAPDDLVGFSQCHFFAGIGVWSHALRQAGWEDDRPVWTGSCPCQPFSSAGQQRGTDDERHLWPAWRDLIRERNPGAIFGEQVSSAAVVGKVDGSAPRGPDGEEQQAWFDVVQADLEAAHYACGAADIPAAGFGAPHIRQRLYFFAHRLGLADIDHAGRDSRAGVEAEGGALVRPVGDSSRSPGAARGLGNADSPRAPTRRPDSAQRQDGDAAVFFRRGGDRLLGPGAGQVGHGRLAEPDRQQRGGRPEAASGDKRNGQAARRQQDDSRVTGSGGPERLADSPSKRQHGGEDTAGPGGRNGAEVGGDAERLADADGGDASAERQQSGGKHRPEPKDGGALRGDSGGSQFEPAEGLGRSGPTNGFWRDADWLGCRDGKFRPVEPGTFPLAHGAPARVVRLRGYGNGLSAPQAQAFIESVMEAVSISVGVEEAA